jgi:hypothetical protein
MFELQRVGQYEGQSTINTMLAAQGFMARQRQMSEAHSQRVDAFARLLGDVISGRQDKVLLSEALSPRHDYIVAEIDRLYPGVIRMSETMSVTDFPQYLTVDVLDRMLYGLWNIEGIPNRALVKEETFNDFRDVKRFMIDGAVSPFEKQGSAGAPPPERALTPLAPITFTPDLYQGMMSINWRAIVNDDLGIFNQLVQSLSSSWNITVWQAITQLYVDANGPNALLYNTANKNIINQANGASVNNPPLDFQGLIDADTVLNKMLDANGVPLVHQGRKYLWYGPGLDTTARALMAALQADISVGGGTTNSDGFPSQRLRVNANYITGGLTPILDKYIPLVCTTSGVKNTMWGITYEPAVQPRPSAVFGMLKGWTTPQVFQKAPNTMRAGGGIDPTLGDFLTMDQDYKAIAIFGGTQVDGHSTVASTGQGS